MNESLKREFNKTFLVLQSEGNNYKETYELEMLEKNSLQGILALQVYRIDGQIQMFYEISAKQTLRDCAQRVKLNGETIRSLFTTLTMLQKELREYLLDMEHVILDMEHIYTKEGTFFVCYCPWIDQDVMGAYRNLLEEILGYLDYYDTGGVALAYHLYQSICQGDFLIEEILEEHTPKKKEEAPKFVELLEDSYIEEADEEETEKDSERQRDGLVRKILKFFLKKKEDERDILKEESFVHEELYQEIFSSEEKTQSAEWECEESNTVLLGNMPAGCWKLRPMVSGYEEFRITEPLFLVGKKREAVDGFIGRDTISRVHSRLFLKNGRLFIVDANSTNGTCVNGVALDAGEEVEIFQGDRILFADVEYECYNSL